MSTPKIPLLPGRFHFAGFALVVCSVLFVPLATLCKASTTFTVYPTMDVWVSPIGSNAAENFLRTRAGTGNFAKDIYIKFHITQADMETGTPIEVKLQLRAVNVPASSNIKIFAANNNWGSGIAWNQVTVDPALLKNQGVTAGVTNQYNVTDYISGPGQYTFCIRSDNSGSETTFRSNEYGIENSDNTSRPQLIIKKPSSDIEYTRLISNVKTRGKAYQSRYLALNPVSSSASDDVHMIGYFDVTKDPYRAKGDGETDDTLAIQRAVNEARDARVAVYFPAGNQFLVTDTIECVQGIIEYENQDQNAVFDPDISVPDYYETTDYERTNHRDYPCVLMGPVLEIGAASRPELVAGNGAFSSDSAPAPLLHFWSRGNTSGNSPTKNFPAASYNHLVRNLDFNLAGKSGAIAINMVGTQGTAIESLEINALGAYAGISGLPGAGGCTSAVTIIGGKYGIDAFESAVDGLGITSVLNNCIIDCSTDNTFQESSIRWNHLGPLVVVGCTIKGGPVRIEGSNIDSDTDTGNTARGNLSIVDSTIELATTGAAITGRRSVYLRNVYCKNVNRVADIHTDKDAGQPPLITDPTELSRWTRVIEYAEGGKYDQYQGHPNPGHPDDFPNDGLNIEPTPRYEDGLAKTAIYYEVAASTVNNVPSSVISKHAWPQAIDWTASDVINVKKVGEHTGGTLTINALGDNLHDDQPAIQAAIIYANNATSPMKVFVPAGDYVLNKGLALKFNTVLGGLHKSYTRLKANDHPFNNEETSFNGGAADVALVTTPASAGASTKIADLMLMQRMTAVRTYLLDWQVGQYSVVQNVNFDRRTVNTDPDIFGPVSVMNIPLIKISGSGGGRWYSMNHQSPGVVGSNYRNITITGPSVGTSQALKFYMFNPEIDSQGVYCAEITGWSNLDVFGSKNEGKESPFVHITDSSDIRWIGLGGNAYCDAYADADEAVLEIKNCSNYVFSSCSFHANFLKKDAGPPVVYATDPRHFFRLKEKNGSGVTIATTPGTKGFVAYRRDSNALIDDND